MKHLRRYNENISIWIACDEMGESIKDILLDISDDGYYVDYKWRKSKLNLKDENDYISIPSSRFNIIIDYPVKIEWDKISNTIHRIESYLNDYNTSQSIKCVWEIYIDNVDRYFKYDSLSEVDDVNPTSKEYQIDIEVYSK